MFDADGPEKAMRELFATIVLPIVLVFTGGWLTFRFVLDDALAGIHPALAEPITVGDAPVGAGGVIVAGHARFALLMAAMVLAGLFVVALYVRTNREAFRDRLRT